MNEGKFPEKIWVDKELINKETGGFYQKSNGIWTDEPIYNLRGMVVYVRETDKEEEVE